MVVAPFLSAKVAELVSASAGHMIASFSLLKHHSAFPALSVLVVILNVNHTVFIALSLVKSQKAFTTKGNVAKRTLGLLIEI
jgi:hypothetical protein